jgi:hypothetical protein
MVVVVGVGIVLFTSAFIHPNGEDILIAQKWRDQGILQACINMLMGFDGRYFTNILHGLSPLSFGWYNGFKITPAVILLLMLAGSTFLLRQIAPNASFKTQLLHAGMLVMAGVAIAPSLPHQLFFYIGSIVYFLPWAFLFASCGFYYLHLKQCNDVAYFAASVVFLIMGNGMNEMFLALNMGIVLLLGYYTCSQHNHREKKLSWIALAIAYFGTSLFFVSSPGITQRLDDHAQVRIAHNTFDFLLYGLQEFWLVYIPHFFTRAWEAIPTIVLLALFIHSSNSGKQQLPLKKMLFILTLGIFFICASTFAYYFSIAGFNDNANRIYNTVYFGIILIGVWSTLVLLLHCNRFFSMQRITYLRGTMVLLLAAGFFNPYNNFGKMLAELNSGTISNFDKQIQERLRSIRKAQQQNGCKTAYFTELTQKPVTIWHNTDLMPNRKESFWNRGYERYFYIDEVRVVGDTSGLFNKIK